MKRDTRLGLIFLIGPFVLLIGSLVGYAIVHFVISTVIASSTADGGESIAIIGDIISIILSIAGMFGTIGIFTSVPLGIYFISRLDKKEMETKEAKKSGDENESQE